MLVVLLKRLFLGLTHSLVISSLSRRPLGSPTLAADAVLTDADRDRLATALFALVDENQQPEARHIALGTAHLCHTAPRWSSIAFQWARDPDVETGRNAIIDFTATMLAKAELDPDDWLRLFTNDSSNVNARDAVVSWGLIDFSVSLVVSA